MTVDRWKDKIVLSNPGTMLVSVEQFFHGQQSVCRNPILQNMFVQLGIGEKAGSGADIIVKGWQDNGWILPKIEEVNRPDRVVLTMVLSGEEIDINRQQTDSKPITNRQQTDNKPTTSVKEIRVLKYLIEGEKSLKELMTICGYKDRGSFRQSVLNGMLKKGWVAMTHPENVNHKDQRYVITDKGKECDAVQVQ